MTIWLIIAGIVLWMLLAFTVWCCIIAGSRADRAAEKLRQQLPDGGDPHPANVLKTPCHGVHHAE